jgi:hypothetical protein
MTAAQRLTQLSGLSGVSAGEHLKRIAAAAGVAGVLLTAYSQLQTGTATQHILVDHGVTQVVAKAITGGGGTTDSTEFFREQLALQIRQEDEIMAMAIAQLIVNGVMA